MAGPREKGAAAGAAGQAGGGAGASKKNKKNKKNKKPTAAPTTPAAAAPEPGTDSQSSHVIGFAGLLAHNDKTIRSRAVKKLRLWLSKKPNHTEEGLLKLWKGIFYCMWMSDKPFVQEELADRLAQLTHAFPKHDQALLFIDTFFKTMAREWHGIDRLRLDKFYMLVTRFLCATFQRLQKCGWEEDTVAMYAEMLKNGPLRNDALGIAVPLGIQMHVATHFLTELARANSESPNPVPAKASAVLLRTVLHLFAHTRSVALMNHIRDEFFEKVLYCIEYERTVEVTAEHSKVDLTQIQFDWDQLEKDMFDLAADPEVLGRNRKTIYPMRRRILDALKERAEEVEKKSKAGTDTAAAGARSKGKGKGKDAAAAQAMDESADGPRRAKTPQRGRKRASPGPEEEEPSDEPSEEHSKPKATPAKRSRKSTGQPKAAADETPAKKTPARRKSRAAVDGGEAEAATPPPSSASRPRTRASARKGSKK